jgi:hypothetical protein
MNGCVLDEKALKLFDFDNRGTSTRDVAGFPVEWYRRL